MKAGKVAIIGGGRVGMSAAFAMILRNTARNLILYDRNVDRMKGEQLEFQHSLSFLGTTTITVAETASDLSDCDVVVYTAGVAQQPGETRLQLTTKNLEIMDSILPEIVKFTPNSVFLIVANPVDILTYHGTKILNLPKGKVFGSGTSLDSARFRFHLSEFLQINPKNIHAYILGEHGDSSFPAVSCADIGGQPLTTMSGFSPEKVQQAYQKTRDAAKAIITAKGATYYAIGVVINQIVDAILRDTKRVFPVSMSLNNEYQQQNVALSIPCVIGKNGIEKILEIPLSEQEKTALNNSAEILKQFIK